MKNIVKMIVLLLGLSLLGGCSYSEAHRNSENLKQVSVGMTKDQVREIMGEPVQEKYSLDNVWFYFTRVCWMDGQVTRDECTPLVFNEEGVLKGIGYPYYQKILDQDHAQRHYVNELL
ncbi:MAG: DUF3192 domain-containing protein [Lentisphaerae bacterium]|nr:DUF3192 domain-containing protein [Lentisphaerota bacterium]